MAVLRCAATSWCVAFALLATTLFLRRLTGALQRPLAAFDLIAVGLLVGAVSTSLRMAWNPPMWHLQSRWRRPARFAVNGTYTVAVVIFGAALSLPGTSLIAALAFWAFLAAGELGGWWHAVTRSLPATRTLPNDAEATPGASLAQDGAERHGDLVNEASTHGDAEEEEDGELLPEGVWQQMTRARDDAGGWLVYGAVRCEFTAGQRLEQVHIAFCPPLQTAPQLTVDQVAGPAVRIKTAMLETFGASLEVKRTVASSEPTSVQLQVFAYEPPSGDAAPEPDARHAE